MEVRRELIEAVRERYRKAGRTEKKRILAELAVHVHSVNTISWTVRRDGSTHLAGRLAGLSWQWIPYVSSGVPLALQLQSVMSSSPDVLILANHGLVVGGESCDDAEALLKKVEDRLEVFPPKASEPSWSQLDRMAAGQPCWRVPDDARVLHWVQIPLLGRFSGEACCTRVR